MSLRLRKAAEKVGHTLPRNVIIDSHVRRWERGIVAPSERYKLYYCAAFGITAGQYGPDAGDEQPPGILASAVRELLSPSPATPPAKGEPAPCLACLVRMLMETIRSAVTACSCATSDPAPGLIQKAHDDGASVFAIAEVFRLTTKQVREILGDSGS